MNSNFGIIQSVLCNSPVKPIAPGCVYGLPEEYGQQPVLANYAIEKSGKQLMAEKLQSAQFGPNIITPDQFQKAKEKKALEEAAAKQQKLFLILGGSTAAVLLGLGVFFIVRRRRKGGN